MLAALAAAGCTTTPRADLPPLALDPPAAESAVVQAGGQDPPAAAPVPQLKPAETPASRLAATPPPPKEPPPVTASPASTGGPLGLDEVLASVDASYPLLRAVEQERAVTGGRLLSTLGVFDLNLLAGIDGQGPATYDNFRSTFGVSQGLPVAGAALFAGYRNGYGDFPTYSLGQKTADGGEFRAGATLPLLRDREIDRPRAAVQQARLDVAIAEPVIARQRLDFHRAAARTYWLWVANGRRVVVARELAKLAADRDVQLRGLVKGLVLAELDWLDNQRLLAQRNGLLVLAERDFQLAQVDLSLFLRDAAGNPTLAGPNRLPEFPAVLPVDPAGFDAELQAAFARRPEPQRLRLQRDRVAVDLRLADNQLLPQVNATVFGTQDVGPGKSSLSGPEGLDRGSLNAGVTYLLPVQRRLARGQLQAAQAQLIQLDFQLRQAEDVIRVEVQAAFAALERSAEFYKQAREQVVLARAVAQGERDKFRIGDRTATVITITLREQAAFDAELTELSALLDYFRALVDFRIATGQAGR